MSALFLPDTGKPGPGGPSFFWRVPCLALVAAALTCSAKGPPVPPPAAGDLRPFGLEGVFFFRPGIQLYARYLRGEVVLEKKFQDPNEGYFKMRTVGLTRLGAIRMRSYEGRAFMRADGALELYGKNCFEFGKRTWEDRLTPLRSWTCDHLVFQYDTTELPARGILRAIRSGRTASSEFLGRADLVALPFGVRPSFSGQVLGLTETGQTVVWGYEGGKKTRDGTALRLLDGFGHQIGQLRVKSRPGDFLICDAAGGLLEGGRVAYTTESVRRGSFFE